MKNTIKKEIKCCPNCGNPVIWTFIIGGSECFCWECKWDGGMLSAERKNWTKEIQEKLDNDTKEFKKVTKHYVSGGCTYDGCEKCERQKEPNDKYHIWHLTQKEKDKHEEAKKILFGKL